MDETAAALVRRAESAYDAVVRNPFGGSDIAALIAEARLADDAESLVVALRAQAWQARYRLAGTVAKQLLDEAARVARRHKLDERLVEVLATRAAVNQELGRVAAARRDLEQAAALTAGRQSADLDHQQAVLHHNSGQLAQAAELYRRLLASPSTPLDIRVKASNNLALVESHRGHQVAALARLDAVRTEARAAGPALVAIVEDSRGWVLVQSGRLAEGLRALAAAADRHREAGLSLGEHYLEHCDALIDLRLLPEAADMAAKARAEFAAHGVDLLAAEAQVRMAHVANLRADSTAADQARVAVDMLRRQRRTAWAAHARVLELQARAGQGLATPVDQQIMRRCARTLESAGLMSWAVDAYLAAGERASTGGPTRAGLASLVDAQRLCAGGPALLRLKGHLAGARHAEFTGARRELLTHARSGLTDLAQHRAALSSTELRALASGHGGELGRLALRTLLRDGAPGDVFVAMERTRAAALLVTQSPQVEGIDLLLAELRSVQEEIGAARSDGVPEPTALTALTALTVQQRAIERRIRDATWMTHSADAVEGAQPSVAELRRVLEGRALVAYAALDGELFAVVVHGRRSRLVRLGPIADVVALGEQLFFTLRRLAGGVRRPDVAVAMRDNVLRTLDRLRTMLLAPLALPPGAPLVVVPSTATWRLPWSQLWPGPAMVTPSAAVWLRTVRRTDPADGEVVLVAGPRLEWASTEIAELASLHQQAHVLLPPASTVAAVVRRLRHARLAHLACHSRLRADNPTFSAFGLSAGELTVHELEVGNVSPYRVVLSACDSGADTTFDGNEFVGFVSALLGRGTAGLLASCVQVSDAEAVPLMRRVHERLVRGDSLADALYSAAGQVDRDRPESLAAICSFSAYGAA